MDGSGGGNRGGLSLDFSTGVGGRGFAMGIDLPINLTTPTDDSRRAVDEMDFFSQDKNRVKQGPEAHSPNLMIKKEDLSINTGLHLLSGTGHSTVDDGLSLDDKEKDQAKSEGMDEKMDSSKQEERDAKVARQFMELGPALLSSEMDGDSSTEVASQERSLSPTAEYALKRSGDAGKEIASFDHEREDGRSGRGVVSQMSPERAWSPGKAARSPPSRSSDQVQEATMRKARVSVRARSEAPMISDGCQWRKYGQKMAKGNPCPRAYYRCTMAAGCPVRKQVQRCADDGTILITTYEGKHNHPLPPAALAMANTTSSAASMLLSGSMPSADGIINPNFLARAVLPCSSSVATISASAPFPTVTLDLTNSPSLPFHKSPQEFQLPIPAAAAAATPAAQIFGQSLCGQSRFSGLQPPSSAVDVQKGQSLADTVSAAITADPNFTAALAAAITSIIGGGAAGVGQQAGSHGSGEQ
ncbi:hypothetical protein HPP92_009681 [Vanilla planifolia]|uniref:WRKY domain-containing protein n=1 Tax=Vanilla planifolia TaxID=51239 RepID=A0A835V4Z2_VANPL|nr:hypothetical protein HPP92_009681 [Vanilla planifolia]